MWCMSGLTVRSCLKKYLQARDGLIVDIGRARIAADILTRGMGDTRIGVYIFPATEEYAKTRMGAHGKRGVVSSSTVKRELGVLKAAMQWAFKSGLIAYVPPMYPVRSLPPKLRVLTEHEKNRLAKQARQESPWLYAFTYILMLTGQRKEAVLGLTWEQIDLPNRVIHFTDTSLTLSERRKGRGTVPINDELAFLLNQIKVHGHVTGFVVNDCGKRIKAIYNAWNRMVKAAGLQGVTPHTLRHTVATNLVRDNANIYKVSQLLGHRSVQTTERVYVHMNHEPLRDMMNGVSAKGRP